MNSNNIKILILSGILVGGLFYLYLEIKKNQNAINTLLKNKNNTPIMNKIEKSE